MSPKFYFFKNSEYQTSSDHYMSVIINNIINSVYSINNILIL